MSDKEVELSLNEGETIEYTHPAYGYVLSIARKGDDGRIYTQLSDNAPWQPHELSDYLTMIPIHESRSSSYNMD